MATESMVPQLVDKKGDDIMESVISCEPTKETWTDLVHSFEGPSNTKENRIMVSLRSGLASLRDLEIPITLRPLTLLISMKDERTSEEYLRDLEIEFRERALLENLKRDCFSKTFEPSYKSLVSNISLVSKVFQPKFTPKLIQSSQQAQSSQNEPKIQKDYKAEYKKIKAKLALLEASSSTYQSPKTIQSKNEMQYIYHLDEFLHEDEPSRQYQANSDISYYIIPHGRSLTELTKDTQVLEVVTPNEQNIPHTKDVEGMLTRSMAVKLAAASASECLFDEFLSKIEPKKVFEALRHPQWVDAMQEELNQFYRNKVWTLVPLPHRKIAIGSKWVFKNKKYELGTVTRNKARLVTQGYSQEEGIDYDETFPCLCHLLEL
ncbi:retrovirus-related pol polyprotein from transposon TNT 1-94 [Tanacetum coccineum]